MKMLQRYRTTLANRLRTLLAPAEDPRHAFTAAAQRQRDLLALVRQALADLAHSREQLHARLVAARTAAAQFDQQARLALQSGYEDLARVAILRQHRVAAEAQLLFQQAQQVQQQEQRLRLHEQQLADQIEEFVARINTILARSSAAEAQVRIQEALSGFSHRLPDLDVVLERAEQESEDIHARASALDRLVAVGVLEQPDLPGGDWLDRKLSQMLTEEAVSAQLATLRTELRQHGDDPAIAAV